MKGGKKQYQETFKHHLKEVANMKPVRSYKHRLSYKGRINVYQEYQRDREFYINLLLSKGKK